MKNQNPLSNEELIVINSTDQPENSLPTIPPQNNRAKNFFFFTLLITIAIFSAIIFKILFNQNQNSKSNTSLYFLFINDLHIDTLYDPYAPSSEFCRQYHLNEYPFKFGQYGCDAPPSVFESFLEYVPSVAPNPSFIAIGGDIFAHGLGLNRTDKQEYFQKYLHQIQEKYPQIPIIFAFGNNDFEMNYGEFETDFLDFQNTSELFEFTDYQRSTFETGGYYFYDVPNSQIRILVLNTVMYSAYRTFLHNDPFQQF